MSLLCWRVDSRAYCMLQTCFNKAIILDAAKFDDTLSTCCADVVTIPGSCCDVLVQSK